MKRILSSSLIVAVSVAVVACDRSKNESSAMEQRIEELEQERSAERQKSRDLERELAAQKVATEWEAIEKERSRLKEERLSLEEKNQEGEIALETLKSLQQRNEELALREEKARELEAGVIEERSRLSEKMIALSEAELALAGREAGQFSATPESSTATVDAQFFADALSPYGSWYDSSEYGSVWQPAACQDPSWRPYTRGQWVCSDQGWAWVSSEPFGWATFHYGRWALLQDRGWIWVPGTEWAPSWCTWRSGDSYVGWAPLPPETMAYSGSGWDPQVEAQYGIGASSFCFVESRYFDRSISQFCLPVIRNANCVRATNNITRIRIINERVFCGGPGYRDLSDKLGRKLPFFRIERGKESYDRSDLAHLRSRVRGDRLVVAAPKIASVEARNFVSNDRRGKLITNKVERTATADPERIRAYREMKERRADLPQRTLSPREAAVARVVKERETAPAKPPVTREIRGREGLAELAPRRERETGRRFEGRPGTKIPGDKATREPQASGPKPDVMIVPPRERVTKERIVEGQARLEQERARRENDLAKAEQDRREKLRAVESTRQREEMTRTQRATREVKALEVAREKQQTAMREQAESARKQRADREVKERALAHDKQREEARGRQQAAMREQAETARKQRADREAKERSQAQERQRNEAREKQQAAMREQAESARKQRAEREVKEREQAQQRKREEAQQRQREEAQRRQAEEVKQRQEQERRQREVQQKQEEARQKQRQEQDQRQRTERPRRQK